jgi:hypothetical protein
MSTRTDFFENHYLKVTDFIQPKRAKELAASVEAGDLRPDTQQVVGSKIIYNHIPLVQLLCEKTNQVSKLLGEPVLPTYAFSRVYRKGSSLMRHSDRPSCEISLTVNLDCSKVWPIWIASPKGDTSVGLKPGEAMLYFGLTDHWRRTFDGKFCTQVFLHYVRANGPYANFYFDRDPNENHRRPH